MPVLGIEFQALFVLCRYARLNQVFSFRNFDCHMLSVCVCVCEGLQCVAATFVFLGVGGAKKFKAEFTHGKHTEPSFPEHLSCAVSVVRQICLHFCFGVCVCVSSYRDEKNG